MGMRDTAAQVDGEAIGARRVELAHRDQQPQTRSMLRLTKMITVMTGVMTGATIVNVVLFALS